jgi:hypothetical protein
MEAFRGERPEVPHSRRTPHIGLGITLLGADKIGKLVGIANKENRSVVAHHVPVAFFGVELNGETPDIALGVGGSPFSGYGREAQEALGFLADLGENLGFGVLGEAFVLDLKRRFNGERSHHLKLTMRRFCRRREAEIACFWQTKEAAKLRRRIP